MPTYDTTEGPNPSGLCQCGCGERTNIARKTANGNVVGTPYRFVLHHHKRKPLLAPPNQSGLCVCGCGEITPIARVSSRTNNMVRGHHRCYIHGHNGRPSGFSYTVDPKTGCWVWDGYVAKSGYGRCKRNGRILLAHRAVYAALVGEIPPGMHLDHRCFNTRCVNPDHLEPVTPTENQRRSRRHKLTMADAREIRRILPTNPFKALAARFGVSERTIRAIVDGEVWLDD